MDCSLLEIVLPEINAGNRTRVKTEGDRIEDRLDRLYAGIERVARVLIPLLQPLNLSDHYSLVVGRLLSFRTSSSGDKCWESYPGQTGGGNSWNQE